VLAIGATGAFAAGTWQEFPSGYPNNEILSCTMGSDGTVYYQIPQWSGSPADTGPGIFAKKNDNNPAENLLSKLPASFVGKRYGVYYDPSRDSLYVGGIDGQVYRGRNGVFTAMPSIPLLYTRLDGSGAYQVKYTHVNGFVRDPKDRLLAVTDSLAWYLDATNQTWIPIGTDADYLHPPLGSPYFSEILVYPNGNVAIGGFGNGETTPTFHWLSPDLKLTGVTRQYAAGMTIGNSGKIYAYWGPGQRYKYADPSKGFQWDTVLIKYPPENGISRKEQVLSTKTRVEFFGWGSRLEYC